MSNNLHYIFHVAYYEALGNADVGSSPYPSLNKALTQQHYAAAGAEIALTAQSFEMETRYPGLLMGLGYPHEVGKEVDPNANDSIKLGFFLDYTTGLPIIPGSTVKGMLRSAFRLSWEYVQETAEDLGIVGLNGEVEVRALETAIFGEWCKDVPSDKGAAPGISQRDAFYDAVPVKPDPEGYLLNLESITPHKRASDGMYIGMKNPTPLKLLKVRPLVRFLFRFRLGDSVIKAVGVTVTADQKKELFKRILSDLGVGAKTNVGFGVMMPTKPIQREQYHELIPVENGTHAPVCETGTNPISKTYPTKQRSSQISAGPSDGKSTIAIALEKATAQKQARKQG